MTDAPLSALATHEVINQPPLLEPYNAFDSDPMLGAAVKREGAGRARDHLSAYGARIGSPEVIQWGIEANRYPPELHTHDRFGHRIDEVVYHPSYHALMALSVEHQVPSIAWSAQTEGRTGGHVAHVALSYMLAQTEAGHGCPMAMTYAVIPALRCQPDVAAQWEDKLLAPHYDGRAVPAAQKAGVTMGMAMTEKQGGSDVRANTTRAEPLGAGGPGQPYALTGHKFFCSAPMSDAFLTLAYAKGGLSCFLVPRWRPDGTRNAIHLQRLKDKLGNRSNASAEIEYAGAWAALIGEEGRGVANILEMVHHTRLDAATSSAGLMRQALVQAAHHARHRSAFQKRLIQQPLMRNVIADLTLESHAAVTLILRLARAFDEAPADPAARAFARLATAVAKYWVCKRTPNHVYEAMECLGGSGYVEESILPRLYREAPVNSIWEGSGNVICLDILRALSREPATAEAFFAELAGGRGGDRRVDAAIDALGDRLAKPAALEPQARALAEQMALTLQAVLLMRGAPGPIAEGFIASRLGAAGGRTYGALPEGLDVAGIIERI